MSELRDQLQGTLGTVYSLQRELDGAGMSRVFVATETALGRTVVIKVLPPELAGGVNMDRFRREVRLAAALQHPHIVPVLAAGEMNGVPYYTMPFVEGESLRARILASGALPLGEAISILRDVARALAYAHARGVAHRDIKPDNVLLSGGVAVVTDFGIAKAISDATKSVGRVSLTATGVSVGTPAYMSPEQAAADPDTDHRTDIYAFGSMAYEMLTGRPPFAGAETSSGMAASLSGVPAPLSSFRPDVPHALETLVLRCLEEDPADRPQRADELIRALDAVVARRTAQMAMPTTLLVPVVLGKVLMLYVAAMLGVLLLVRGAIVWLRLPPTLLMGAMGVTSLGIPFVLRTSWLHYRDRRAASEAPAPTSCG